MVRQSKQTPEQRNVHKKRTLHQDKPSLKKPSDTAVWPCSINGCNKQFAREADLKRHQRTTKLHSVPGFACPQCDARFTRTDALRRHQKSRHNGVVIEPTGTADRRSTGDEATRSSGSRSNSRSTTPPSNENPAAHTPLPPATVPPPGAQSYYRQHTFAGVMIPPGMVVDGHYPPAVGLPTSATRLHQASWPSPWPGDASQPPPHMIHPGYPHPYYNTPQQYYRPGAMLHADVVAHEQMPNGVGSGNDESSSSRQGSPVIAVDPTLDHVRMEASSETTDHETVVIDPSLVSPSISDTGDSPTDRPRIPETRASSSHTQHIPSPGVCEPSNGDGSGSDSESVIVRSLLSPSRDHPFTSSSPLEHSLNMEQILTEDGEPMLNPAELLTQESLASPPPS